VTVIPKDLSRPTAPEEIYREIESKGIEVDVLVNNAGFNVYGPFSETDSQTEFEMMLVNMIALTRLTKLFLPAMLNRNSGKILNVASTAAFTPGPYAAVYCAGKAYVLSFSEAIAEELRGSGVTVTTLCPGPTLTKFAERANMSDTKIFQGRLASAKDVAEAGYGALMRGKTTVIVGLANRLLIFSLRFSPRRFVALVAKGLLSRVVNPQHARVRPAH
jgi:short-subunit dehydrogenase